MVPHMTFNIALGIDLPSVTYEFCFSDSVRTLVMHSHVNGRPIAASNLVFMEHTCRF